MSPIFIGKSCCSRDRSCEIAKLYLTLCKLPNTGLRYTAEAYITDIHLTGKLGGIREDHRVILRIDTGDEHPFAERNSESLPLSYRVTDNSRMLTEVITVLINKASFFKVTNAFFDKGNVIVIGNKAYLLAIRAF